MGSAKETIVIEVDAKGVPTAFSSSDREIARFEASVSRAGKSVNENFLVKLANLEKVKINDPQAVKDITRIREKILGDMQKAADGSAAFGEKIRNAIQNPMQAAGDAIGGLVTKLGPLGVGLSVGAAAIGMIAKSGWDWAKSLAAMGDQIEDTASRMGLTIPQEEAFRFAMNRSGADMGTLENIMRKLSQEIDTGGANLTKMGLRFRDVQTGELRPMSQTILELSQRLAAMPEGPIRNAAAIKVMGRAALEVLPDLVELGEGIKRAGELHAGWTEANVKRSAETRKAIADITSEWDLLVLRMKEPVVAVITVVVKKALDVGLSTGYNPKSDWLTGLVHPDLPFGKLNIPAASELLAAQAKQDASVARNDAAIRARLQSTDEERLSAAKKKLEELGKELPTGVMYSAERFKEFDAQKAIVTQLEKQIELRKENLKIAEALTKEQAAWVKLSENAADKQLRENVKVTSKALDIVRDNQAKALSEGIQDKDFLKAQELQQKWREDVMKDNLAIEDAKLKASIDTDEKIVKAWDDMRKQRFEDLKRGFEGLFDAAFAGARSFWEALKRMALTIFLAPIKEALGNMFASAMMGGGGASAGGGWRSMAGGLGTALAGAGGSGGGYGGAALPGMMPGWAGSQGGGFSGAGMLGNLKGMWSSGKGMLTSIGNIGGGWRPDLNAAGQPTMVSTGGGLAAGAALVGGGTLAAMGLMRGGKVGAGMSAGGGALVGAALGTMFFPGIGTAVGALIGGAIGAGAGLIRMLFKGAAEKCRAKIKALYQIDIQTKSVLEKIVQLAKEGYGGNLDMAIRTEEVRSLIELYGMSTGQGRGGLPATMQPVNLIQRSGSLYSQPVGGGGLSKLGAPTGTGGGGTIVIPLTMDSKVIGTVIVQNGRVIADGALQAAKSNYRRVDNALSSLSPSTIRG